MSGFSLFQVGPRKVWHYRFYLAGARVQRVTFVKLPGLK